VPRAVARALPQIRAAVARIVASLQEGGRLWLVGAGTSGRLCVLEAAECPPTFGTPRTLIQAVIAGGRSAVFRAREGLEDDRRAARTAIRRRVHAGDLVVGVAASGVTPFVRAALSEAHARAAATVLVTCHPRARPAPPVDVLIAAPVGPELIAGSTRLKAGTATKLILNMLTVASMVRLGKVYGNLMVDVRPTSRKLTARATRIISTVARVSPQSARRALREADGHVPSAIVIAARGVTRRVARSLLARHHGRVHDVLGR